MTQAFERALLADLGGYLGSGTNPIGRHAVPHMWRVIERLALVDDELVKVETSKTTADFLRHAENALDNIDDGIMAEADEYLENLAAWVRHRFAALNITTAGVFE